MPYDGLKKNKKALGRDVWMQQPRPTSAPAATANAGVDTLMDQRRKSAARFVYRAQKSSLFSQQELESLSSSLARRRYLDAHPITFTAAQDHPSSD
jgi:hypothetical protein